MQAASYRQTASCIERICVIVICAFMSIIASATDYFIFTSFRGNGEDGLHLALSTNGYHWRALNDGRSFLKPEIGGYKLMRDPCLAQGPDGTFHLVWTTGWTTDKGHEIGYASSRDLIQWSTQRGIELLKNEGAARNLWAPELFYDKKEKHWLILWSTTIPGRFPETDNSGDDGYNHRIYSVTTKDFRSFTRPKLFFDPGFNVIDATILAAKGKYYLFFKDERKTPLQKKLRYAVAERSEGPFGAPSQPFTGDWVEGPSAIKIGGFYYVYFDHYTDPEFYGAVRSRDFKHWEDCSSEMRFPQEHRHGTVLRVSKSVANRLLQQDSGLSNSPGLVAP